MMVAGLLSLALVGFGQVPGDPGDEAQVPAEMVIDPALQPLIDLAQQDLAMRLGISSADIEALDARAVVWPDGALGCPAPGMAYIQILQDGALIRLRVGDMTYEYHSGGTRPPFLCEQPVAPSDPGGMPLARS